MLFPLASLDELTDDGLQELQFQVTLELERRAEAEYEALEVVDTEAL